MYKFWVENDFEDRFQICRRSTKESERERKREKERERERERERKRERDRERESAFERDNIYDRY